MNMDSEERKYRQLKRLGQELHLPIPEAFWEFEVRDRHGRLLQRHSQRCHSWTRNAYNALFTHLAGKDADDTAFGAGLLSLKDTSGVVKYGSYPFTYGQNSVDNASTPGYRAAAAVDDKGILVGGGTNPESFEDYALQTQIPNGTGAGQLSHVQSEPHDVSYDTPTRVLRNQLVRYFNNNSGGNIDVNEVVLASSVQQPGAYPRFIMSRDKLSTTVTVPDTGQLKVTYTVQLTYPA
jgi:hypothetical protein